jgi:hypothetical protein
MVEQNLKKAHLFFLVRGASINNFFLILPPCFEMIPMIFPKFSMHSPRVFSIAPHFCTIWFAQSSPLLTYITGPKGESALTSSHRIFYFEELLKFQFSKLIIFIIIIFFRNFLFKKNTHTHNTFVSRFFPKKIFFFCKIAKNALLLPNITIPKENRHALFSSMQRKVMTFSSMQWTIKRFFGSHIGHRLIKKIH